MNKFNGDFKKLVYDYFGGMVFLHDVESLKQYTRKLAVISNVLYKNAQVKFENIATPYCDRPKVALSTAWLIPEFWEILLPHYEGEKLYLGLSNTIGVLVHETGHLTYTDNTNLESCIKSQSNFENGKLIFACDILNIVEDFYIDEEARYAPKTKRLSVFTDVMRQYLNSKKVKLVNGTANPFETSSILASLLNPVYSRDNEYLLEARKQIGKNEIMDLFFNVIEKPQHNQNDRINTAIRITDLIWEDYTEEQINNEKFKVQLVDENGEITVTEHSTKEMTVEEFLEQVLNNPEIMEAIEGFIEKYKQELDELSKDINSAAGEQNGKLDNDDNDSSIQKIPKVPCLAGQTYSNDDTIAYPSLKHAYDYWSIPHEFKRFANYIKQRTSFNNKSQRLNYDGFDIDVDSIPYAMRGEKKIFIDTAKNKTKDSPQVVIRVDGSGSMQWRTSSGKSLRQVVLEACCGFMFSMQQTRIPFFAFMDTTLHSNKLAIFKLGCNRLPGDYDLGNTKIRNYLDFEKRCMYHQGTQSNGNSDGYALEYGSMFAQDRSRSKLLISLSDGTPTDSRKGVKISAPEYTKNVIENLRKQNWTVISFSLVHEVFESNNNIYGERFNYNVSDNIVGAFTSLANTLYKLER